jgi:hypothetical protein
MSKPTPLIEVLAHYNGSARCDPALSQQAHAEYAALCDVAIKAEHHEAFSQIGNRNRLAESLLSLHALRQEKEVGV